MIQGLAQRLRNARLNSNLTRKQVAENLNVSESLIGLYESSNRQPTIQTLMKLASLYHVTTDYLLGCEAVEADILSLSGLTDKQKQVLTLTAQCFREQNH